MNSPKHTDHPATSSCYRLQWGPLDHFTDYCFTQLGPIQSWLQWLSENKSIELPSNNFWWV